MTGFGTIIEELRTRTKTKSLNIAFLRSQFHRKCVEHYANLVLPQLELFESHLMSQRVVITTERLHQHDENVLMACLEMQNGILFRVLQIRYDYRSKDLSFLQTNGSDRTDVICCQSFVNFDKLSSVQVYDIVAEFVRSVYRIDGEEE
jgi:hypothetical protein